MRLFAFSKLGIFGFLLANIPTVVQSHATEIRYCFGPQGGTVRIFVEHWHKDLGDNPLQAGRIRFRENKAFPYNSATPTLTVDEFWRYPTGNLNNILPENLWQDGRCLSALSYTDQVGQCDLDLHASRSNDWVYFDFPLECNNDHRFTLLEGETEYLTEGCEGLYPASTLGNTRFCAPEPTLSPTVSPTNDACIAADTFPPDSEFDYITCKDLGGTCEPECDPAINNCFQEDTLCEPGISHTGSCYCVIPLGIEAPTTCNPTPAPSPVPTPRPTRSPSQPTRLNEAKLPALARLAPPPIAGYLPRTDVKEYLKKDLLQQELEDSIVTPPGSSGNEDCVGFANAEDFIEGAGDYFKTIPTYIDTVSDPYQEMVEYYGGSASPSSGSNFLQRWVKKAYQKRNFLSVTNRGSALFQDAFIPPSDVVKDCIGFEEVLKKGLSYGGALIESYQLMQKAIDLAEGGCSAQNNTDFGGPEPCMDAIEAWDAAAAIYVGSLEGTDGNNAVEGNYGKSPYSLADKRCRNFRTCGPDNGANYSQDGSDPKDITASINARILALFQAGAHAAWLGEYTLMKGYLRLISNKSAVPLIQGAFRYYYRFSDLEFGPNSFAVSDKQLGEGAAFIFPVLPKLWACSKKGEKLAYAEARVDRRRNVQAGQPGEPIAEAIDFLNVQYAFECNYRCLGIKCAEVGELYDGRDPNGSPPDDGPGPKPGFVGCDDDTNGSSDVCAKQKGQRKAVCKLFTGSPGIKDRNKLRFDF